MPRKKNYAVLITSCAVLIVLGATREASAQNAATTYPAMAPISQYLMEPTAEIALARSAAPESISRDATVLVLGSKGYDTAVEGKNGFVCMVGRGWNGPFGLPEAWNPRIRAAVCLNPQAARSILPIARLRTRLVLAGKSESAVLSAVKSAYDDKQLPALESGAMAYMMSKSAYLTDEGEHDVSHVMFYTLLSNSSDWGSGADGSPIQSSPLWYFAPKDEARTKGLPPVLVFLVMVPEWADGR